MLYNTYISMTLWSGPRRFPKQASNHAARIRQLHKVGEITVCSVNLRDNATVNVKFNNTARHVHMSSQKPEGLKSLGTNLKKLKNGPHVYTKPHSLHNHHASLPAARDSAQY